MKALILVDLQNDFLPGGALAVKGGDEIVSVANRMMKLKGRVFERIVATQDWHPPDHGSFALNNPGRSEGEFIELGGLPQVLWPVHCVQGAWGAQFAPTLEVGAIDQVFRKGSQPAIDSYSGFYDNQKRHATGLDEYLELNGITEVVILGLATDYCVKFTALDAIELGYVTWLIEDGCRAVELQPGDGARSVEELRSAGVRVIRSDQIR